MGLQQCPARPYMERFRRFRPAQSTGAHYISQKYFVLIWRPISRVSPTFGCPPLCPRCSRPSVTPDQQYPSDFGAPINRYPNPQGILAPGFAALVGSYEDISCRLAILQDHHEKYFHFSSGLAMFMVARRGRPPIFVSYSSSGNCFDVIPLAFDTDNIRRYRLSRTFPATALHCGSGQWLVEGYNRSFKWCRNSKGHRSRFSAAYRA